MAVSVVHGDDEEGQGLAEYALILALIAIVAIVALLFLGNQISDKLSVIGGTLESHQP
ncbi:MAG: Flp family type IVb pilin [Chloroflexota bacterium]